MLTPSGDYPVFMYYGINRGSDTYTPPNPLEGFRAGSAPHPAGPSPAAPRAPRPGALPPPPPPPQGGTSPAATLTPEQQRLCDLGALLEFEEQDRERARGAWERAKAVEPPLDDSPAS